MGQSVSRQACAQLSHLPADQWEALATEDMTVIRTNGEHQAGWRFPRRRHSGGCNYTGKAWATSHVASTSTEGEMRFHMTHDSTPVDPNEHVCGWRRERTFWPTRLTDEEAKKAWWDALDVMVQSLRIRENIPAEELAVLDAAEQALEAEHEAQRIAADNALEREAAATNNKWREGLVESITEPQEPRKSFTDYIMDLQSINVWHANRMRRLFDCGLPKSKVAEICEMADNDAREKRLDEEEYLRYLDPLAKPVS
jgi:hypothetical protein